MMTMLWKVNKVALDSATATLMNIFFLAWLSFQDIVIVKSAETP